MNDKLNSDGLNVVRKMLFELSTLKYAYRSTIEGCYEYTINKYGLIFPIELKPKIIESVIQILRKES